MASPTQWTWVWVNSGSWWWTRRPGMLQSMVSHRLGDDWATELNYNLKIGTSWQSSLRTQLKIGETYFENFVSVSESQMGPCYLFPWLLMLATASPVFLHFAYSVPRLHISRSSWWRWSYSVVSDSLRPHEPQHTRPPSPSTTPWVYPNACPLSWWCHPIISSSVVPFSSCLHSFPASGSNESVLPIRWQSIGVSTSTSVLSMKIQDWFPLGWTGWISLQTKGLSRIFSNTQFKSINSLVFSFPYSQTFTSIHDYWKSHSLD